MQKEGHWHLRMSLENISFRLRMVALLNNATRTRTGQISVGQNQNLTVTSWRRMLMRSTWFSLGLAFPRSVVFNISKGTKSRPAILLEKRTKNLTQLKKLQQKSINTINTSSQGPSLRGGHIPPTFGQGDTQYLLSPQYCVI